MHAGSFDRLSRRDFLHVSAAGGAALSLGGCGPVFAPTATQGRALIAPAADYESDLSRVILDGLREFPELAVRGKSILLKPNLVETTGGDRPINTHPAVVAAAAEAFRRLDAREVLVADGPGHRRDVEMVLEQSGLGPVLREADLPFIDLNHDAVFEAVNAGGRTSLERLYLPVTLKRADLVVSLAKLKTHHWAGATLTMKNCFGLMPGIVYGWPKNILHWAGRPSAFSIDQSIADIVQTVRPAFGIIDGVIGMEGDGPIMGSARHVGCLVMGDLPASVDATAASIMNLQPHRVRYLRYADSPELGGTNPARIAQRGERIERFRGDFAVLPKFEYLKQA